MTKVSSALLRENPQSLEPSIWDTYTAIEGKIKNNDHAKVATDFYHHYETGTLSLAFSLSFLTVH
jgi:beta-glucosidase/6-phospho-beta-glucosidase/beta-galactosidase